MNARSPVIGLCLAACLLDSPQCAAQRASVAGRDFRPVMAPAPGQDQVHVEAFALDIRPVTNAQFLSFVQAQASWRRDRISPLFADAEYLSHWASPDALGANARPEQPVTRVSWFAARAYCRSVRARLPTWYQWELAAAADEKTVDARSNPVWRARILDWYAKPAANSLPPVGIGTPNIYGIYDLHGLIWEWVDDFSSLMISGDSRTQGDPDKLAFCGSGALSAQDRDNYPILMRIAFLGALEGRSTARSLGFRCASQAAP